MHAAYISRPGPAHDIRYGTLPAPVPGPGEVLVQVRASAVNHVDTFVRSGAWTTELAFPFVIGRDLAGTVVEAPPGSGFAPGDRVWGNSQGHAGRPGAAAQFAAVAADRLYRLPEGVDPVEAVAVAHPAATAHLALFAHGALRPGETVLVRGAAGNVGSALTVMAAAAGARVVAVCGAADADRCRALGADAVADYRSPDLEQHLRALAPDGVDLAVDTSARNDLEADVALLARRGRIVVLSGLRTRPVLPVGPLYLIDGSVRGFAISHATVDELRAAADRINELLARGLLRPPAVTELPLARAADAHALLEGGGARGKLVLLPPGPDAADRT
ncbi:NADPH:quinone reductase [Kitasatospora phosalacinea]|uniref:NADPH:quinone reductase n=1 Tax=Kitasatospora phosalacinea TaxID=2065 RepID=UPI00365A344C